MGCSVSWFANQRPKEDLHTHASCEGCDVAGRNSERSLRGECSSDLKGHGTKKHKILEKKGLLQEPVSSFQ